MKNTNRDNYHFAATHTAEEVMAAYGTRPGGLTSDQLEHAREKYGKNVIESSKQDTLLVKVIKAFVTPFTVILLLLAGISFFTDVVIAEPGEQDYTGMLIIIVMVIISGIITLVQGVQSDNAASKLASLVKVSATVIRNDYHQRKIFIEKLVCGDIVYLSAGDMIPADLRLYQAKDLFISQSAMTGESEPVEKFSMPEARQDKNVTDYDNLAFMGTNVVSGSAIGIIIAVGSNTMFGDIAQSVTTTKGKTSFELGIDKVSWVLIRFMLIMVPIVFVINGVTSRDWLGAFLFGLSVAVGLTPEMLPMIVSSNLLRGANHMAKKGTIIKNINSIQNFGAIDVLCTDKTGTLTQDKIVLEYHLDIAGNTDANVLRHAFFNSYYQTGLKNLMDRAIIEAAHEELDIPIENYEKVDEIPFDFQRRRMSVVIKDKTGKTQMITKGAVEEMLAISTHVEYHGKAEPLTSELKRKIEAEVNTLNKDGLRVLGVAQKRAHAAVGEFSVADEREMVLMGYLAFLDPPKETTAPTLKTLAKHNVAVKVLTGDNEMITRSVCKQVGIDVDNIVYGHQIDSASETELTQLVGHNNVFVKLSPQQKTTIVTKLRKLGHTVGFLGDGINDAPAMKASDVGISVDTAVDIAKESADVILLKKDLLILEQGIVAGRKVFANIMKYIKITASSNFGNMFSVLFAAVFLPFLPMLPIQLLFLNLIYDISCISLPWDNVDKEYLYHPKKWNAKSITRFMVWFGPTSSVFDIITYLVLYLIICPQLLGGSYEILDANGQLMYAAIFHTGWFIESIWTQTLVIHFLRTPKIPFFQSRASFIVTLFTTIAIFVGTAVAFTPVGKYLKMAPLPANYFLWLGFIIIGYMILVSIVKYIYIKKYKELL